MPSNIKIPSNSNTRFANNTYEQALLGIVLSDNRLANRVIPYLMEEDFYFLENKKLFKILSFLFQNNISINDDQIVKFVQENPGYNEVNLAFLMQIYKNAGLSSNIQTYLEELIKLTKLRIIEARLFVINNDLATKTNISDESVFNDLQKLLFDIDRSKVSSEFLSAKEVSDEYYRRLENRRMLDMGEISGLATGYTELDNTLQGLQPGYLIILAARPAMGKTAFALNIASNVARKENQRVAFFSLEMQPLSLMNRIYGFNSEVSLNKLSKPQLLTDNDVLKINAVKSNIIDKLNLFIDDNVNNNLSMLMWKCRRLHKVSPLSLIVIDYLQLITPDDSKKSRSESRQQEITLISRSLKKLALELNVPIIALSQLSREVEKREEKRPLLSDLRESGAIEQDADVVMFMYRESYYNRKKNSEEQEKIMMEYGDVGVPVELIIAKNRNGANITSRLKFQMTIGKITNLDDFSQLSVTEEEEE